jgi:hypothetical protein
MLPRNKWRCFGTAHLPGLYCARIEGRTGLRWSVALPGHRRARLVAQPMNEQMYWQIPDFTSMSNPDLAGTLKT